MAVPHLIFYHPCLRIVLTSINFHNQFGFRAIKVHDVIADNSLPVKLAIAELFLSKSPPKPGFGVGHILPKLAG
jgi:hypothetical protein